MTEPTSTPAKLPGQVRWWRDVPPWVWPLAALMLLVVALVTMEYIQTHGGLRVALGPIDWTIIDHRKPTGGVFGFSTFLKPENLLNILNANSYVGVVAIGMTFVIISAGIDLSVGSMLAMLGVLGLLAGNRVMGLSWAGEGAAVAMAFTLMITGGAAAGTVNGLLVSLGRIAPFIVTLGGFAAFRPIALTAAESGEVRYGGAGAFSWLGTTGIPIPGTNIAGRFATEPVPLKLYWSILIFLSVAALGWVLLNRTRFGRYTIAIGANERAALYSAVPVRTVKTLVYVLMGALVGLAALMLTSRMNSIGSGSAGVMLELDAIAAVVVGGTRLSGGRGSIAGTVFGVLIMGVIPNMMVMLNIDSNLQGLVKGAVIVLAVLIQKKA